MITPAQSAPEPRANPLLLGHEDAERTLRQSYFSNRLPHAWLITGIKGIGKATLAYRFARFVLTGGGVETRDDLCVPPEHPVFKRVAARSHADLLTITRARDEDGKPLRSEIVAEDARAIGPFLHMTAAEGGWRVAVIDSADEMNVHAANALLKILEEPSARSLIILVSHSPGRLLPTIRSRCRRLALRPLPESAITRLLAEYEPGLSASELAQVVRLAEGSAGRALSLARRTGLDVLADVSSLLDALPALDLPAAHALADRLGRAGGEEMFEIAGQLISRWSQDRIAATARDPLAMCQLERPFEVWEKVSQLFAHGAATRLDRKQVVLGAVMTLAGAYRS